MTACLFFFFFKGTLFSEILILQPDLISVQKVNQMEKGGQSLLLLSHKTNDFS